MSNDFGNDFIVITDEQGVEIELEHLDTVEFEGETYMAFTPAGEDDSDEGELIILKVEPDPDNPGEDLLVTLDDDNLTDTLFTIFLKRFDEVEAESEEEFGEE